MIPVLSILERARQRVFGPKLISRADDPVGLHLFVGAADQKKAGKKNKKGKKSKGKKKDGPPPSMPVEEPGEKAIAESALAVAKVASVPPTAPGLAAGLAAPATVLGAATVRPMLVQIPAGPTTSPRVAVGNVSRPSVPVAAAPVYDHAYFAGLLETADSAMDRWNLCEAMASLAAGGSPGRFIFQAEREGEIDALHSLLNQTTGTAERWRIGEQIEALAAGKNPPPFVDRAAISGQMAALELALQDETDPREITRIAAQISAVESGKPFVSRESATADYAALSHKFEAANSSRERWDIAALFEQQTC